MQFTKAIILSETDFRILVNDILDGIIDYDKVDEATPSDYAEEIASEMWEYIVEEQDVDCLLVYVDGRSREVYSEDELASLIEWYYE